MASSSYSYVTGGAGNQKTLTLSGWFKVCTQVSGGCFFSYYYASTTARSEVFLGTTNELKVGICPDGSTWKELTYPNVMRDPGAWYNLVVAYDTTESVEADRVKTYINGNQITAASGTYPSLNEDTGWFASGYQQTIGRYESGDASYVDGCVTHVNFIEGTAYAPTAFGEFDATSGIWIAKSGPSVTYGDEGGFWKFASGALTTDSSGNSNTLTAVGTPTECKDSPDNNFSTGSSLLRQGYPSSITIANGNNTITDGGSDTTGLMSTIGVSSGKWYVEFKRISGTNSYIGVCGASEMNEAAYNNELGVNTLAIGLKEDGNIVVANSSSSFSGTYTNGDVISVALDMDNDKVYFAKDGAWATGSGAWDSTTFDAAVGAQAVNTGDDTYVFGCSVNTSSTSINFGNGYFGTTVVTSAEADGNGEGQFEFAPPTGYFALCTNNLGSES